MNKHIYIIIIKMYAQYYSEINTPHNEFRNKRQYHSY